jgi:hypothetical protein
MIAKPAPRVQQFDEETHLFKPAPENPVQVERWTANEKRFAAHEAAPTTLAVRLLNYPGWKVQVDGGTVSPDAAPETAQMLVAIAAGVHQVEVQFTSTWDRTAGAMISAIFAILLAAYMFFIRGSRKRVQSSSSAERSNVGARHAVPAFGSHRGSPNTR